jgi:HK97 family phage portal protein
MRGLSRAEALRSTLENEQEARKSTSSWWKRGARPSLMLSSDKTLSPEAASRLQAQVEQNHGGAGQAAGTLILEEGMKPVPVQLSAEEMQYIESRKLNREEVCAVYDVPPPVVHILDHATFSNITEQMRSMYRDTMAPRLEDVESVIRHHLLPEFDLSGKTDATFSLDEVLRGDFETRATAVGNLIEKGVMKPSEGRPLFDLPDAGPVADKLYANAALQELGKPAERVSLTEAGSVTPDQQRLLDEAQAAAALADSVDQNTGNGGTRKRRRTNRALARAVERQSTQEVPR